MFKFSRRSASHLKGVNSSMVDVCYRAIELTEIDFGIIDGLRTLEEQKLLVSKGASWTMDSAHLRGEAVDVMAYIGRRGSWEFELYYEIASAMGIASLELGIPIRWGGAWHCYDLGGSLLTPRQLTEEYVELRKSQGKKPSYDAGHFELVLPKETDE